MADPTPPVPSHAALDWREDGQPVSTAFDDIYFSTASGLEETRYVFITQNRLPERWAALTGSDIFSIGETGFGTGLNFLATWQQWQRLAPGAPRLHFVSVEKYPLHRKDLERALALWPELATFSEQLIEQYPPLLTPGVHRLKFDGGRVQLTLSIGEASDAFTQLQTEDPQRDAMIDAWFLDGFAPSKNPDMWRPELFSAIARLSADNATFATFTCAGIVKRGLKGVGFEIEKVPGFGHKREMLRGQLASADPQASAGQQYTQTPWHLPDAPTRGQPCTVAIIGAGIAGATLARALAERGLKVAVFEQGAGPGSGASGNDQGILYAKLSPKPGPNGDFNLQALQFALRYYLCQCPDAVHFDGLLQLAQSEKEQGLQQQIADTLRGWDADTLVRPVSAQEATDLSGVPLDVPGLYLPNAGWLEPRNVCSTLLEHPSITLHSSQRIESIEHRENHWQLSRHRETFHADVLALCTANGIRDFARTKPLPLQPIRGQVSFAQATDRSRKLKIALCGEGYIAPAHRHHHNPQHSFGATFKLKQTDTEVRAEEQQENLDTLRKLLPDIAADFAQNPMTARAALRAATLDYLPMAGPVADWHSLADTYAPLRKNRKQLIPQRCHYQPGLFVLGGLGSRGFTYAPLAAEVVASWISGEVMPVEGELVRALHPMRFAIRALGKDRPLNF
ncbi:bifunctional tRNA (5-methylaminomethyl-2-thiouridine)(34)-methyltransferase MnmD/FAD-dependent 5-carboxymethylaminomethyl-2-thiouridine(34) oxidoreductase MnmC [Microbulbifer celer]|uniref:tRNA 5-methylaminomethyl-2-thiouridine biosynthesis bifunctional protein MnmC n=1 Tax=Microbulbifer celer TaxID=435905 RepID=A0ABW3UEZ7_9GAMM|nr:bifunctional tRNA (5-methylaminomethyl-2-thiouridine)(34)-methyltransferase MnmD/FAD-dependent 5-carboxymethylaminomethyl-2-thiouridine(34) oxidoreductase MnmC [Microbulbifer celer]UFN59157.1 bifunctional tRNA (5-methylaminomethyl-2-thiouridine)(34)-methyltransferase MnmD/FAD-dependent 5-carboxymethylaminomethyl-2-thiouridine(34) oxidoreductase MnmC [Microbulbifer celer]